MIRFLRGLLCRNGWKPHLWELSYDKLYDVSIKQCHYCTELYLNGVKQP